MTTQRGEVEQATRRDLGNLGVDLRAPSGLAASLLSLAKWIDGSEGLLTPRDAASMAAEYRQTMAELRKAHPQQAPQEDSLAKRRARRSAAGR
jgi:hypothetical protein